MRAIHVIIGALAVLSGGCKPHQLSTVPAPVPGPVFTLDRGALVRIHLAHGDGVVIGRLLADHDPTDRELVLGDDRVHPDELSRGLGVRIVPLGNLERIEVRAKATGAGAYTGFHVGAFIGYLINRHDKKEAGAGMVLGGYGGMGIGAAIASLITTWVPVFPCNPHWCYSSSQY